MREGTIGDRYRIARRLGTGGMSRVYLCWDERLHLWCAIKVMNAEAVGESILRARFVQEARTLARLGHPHLVRLYDLVDHVESPFMVMEYLEGGTVASRLARGEIALHHAVRLAAETCAALAAAHSLGVIHRDVKPQNLLLTADGTLKVSDFGVARVEQEMRLTLSNMSLGTLAYMPPEQQRDASKVDHRADIYAAGATLYALVTGRRPTSLVTAERARAITALPPEIRHIVDRATAPERDERYVDAVSMEEALQFALKQIPPSSALPLIDRVEPPPEAPPAEGEAIDVDPSEIIGTERTWSGAASQTTGQTSSHTPSQPSAARSHTTFREIDPSRDSIANQTVLLAPPRPSRPPEAAIPTLLRAPEPPRRSLARRLLVGILALSFGLVCGGSCAGVMGVGGIGALFAIGQ